MCRETKWCVAEVAEVPRGEEIKTNKKTNKMRNSLKLYKTIKAHY